MKISIRDDDLCYYSDYSEFIKFYNELNIPVSASVTPFAVPNHGSAFHFGCGKADESKPISENKNLIKSLKNDVKSGKVEILLHGFDHKYKLINGQWVPEMIWKQSKELEEETKKGKDYLENLFDTKISVFVAPSQAINKKGISALENNNLNFSGMPSRINERKFSLKFVYYLLKRYINRLLYGIPIQGKMVYKRHCELGIIPVLNFEKFLKVYKICKKKNWNIVIVTHYWQMSENNDIFENLKQIVKYIKDDGIEFCHLGSLFS